MTARTLYIFQDESGSLADISNTVVIIALVTTLDPQALRWILKKVHKQYLARKGKRYKDRGTKEFKYSTTERPEREKVLTSLRQKQVDIFVLCVAKGNKKIPDSSEHHAILLAESLEKIQSRYPQGEYSMFLSLDCHFSHAEDERQFEQILIQLTVGGIVVQPTDSRSSPFINLADFVAGAARELYERNTDTLISIIEENIVFREIVEWEEVKRKWLPKLPQ